MASRFVETQDLILEVETGDSTLPNHLNRKIWYIEPNEDGTQGLEEDAVSVDAEAVAGDSGDSVNQGEAITLIPGVYSFWSESDDVTGLHCVSPAHQVLVEQRGTVRR